VRVVRGGVRLRLYHRTVNVTRVRGAERAPVHHPILGLARPGAASRLCIVLENGFVNLVAVVAFLILSLSIIPAVLYLGTPKSNRSDPK
jgi:hypothetical protein